MFRYEDGFVANDKGAVLDVEGKIDADYKNMHAYKKDGKISQQWDIVYVDEWKGDPKKGELNKVFGLYVERDFHIVS
jgi:hypothetical protein